MTDLIVQYKLKKYWYLEIIKKPYFKIGHISSLVLLKSNRTLIVIDSAELAKMKDEIAEAFLYERIRLNNDLVFFYRFLWYIFS